MCYLVSEGILETSRGDTVFMSEMLQELAYNMLKSELAYWNPLPAPSVTAQVELCVCLPLCVCVHA